MEEDTETPAWYKPTAASALITEQLRPEKLWVSLFPLFFYKVTDRLLHVNELWSHCVCPWESEWGVKFTLVGLNVIHVHHMKTDLFSSLFARNIIHAQHFTVSHCRGAEEPQSRGLPTPDLGRTWMRRSCLQRISLINVSSSSQLFYKFIPLLYFIVFLFYYSTQGSEWARTVLSSWLSS